jgi:hypothetical protein
MDEDILLLVEIMDHLDENQRLLLDQMESILNYLFKLKNLFFLIIFNIQQDK